MIPFDGLKVAIAKDGLHATVVVAPSLRLAGDELATRLVAHGIVYGLDAAACESLLTLALYGHEMVIAQGSPSVPGVDAAFVPLFDSGVVPGKIRDDGSIDFHDRDVITSVVESAVLGKLLPQTKGTPGVRVDGQPIVAVDGKAACMVFGPGVVLHPDGTARAARSGVIVYRPNASLDVTDHHCHRGNVDLKTGDLRLEGSVSVHGSVARTFRVEATGDVEVTESVDGGSVHGGGAVRVRGTVRGGDTGKIWAGGDASLRSAESASVLCFGILRVAEALNSRLSARHIEVTRRLRGGSLAAEGAIIAQEAGTPDGTPTYLTVGEPLGRTPDDVVSAVENAKALRSTQRRRSCRPPSPGGERGRGGKATRVHAAVTAAEIQDRVALAARREALAKAAFVHIAGDVHVGVVVQIGPARFDVETALSAVRFRLNTDSRAVYVERARK